MDRGIYTMQIQIIGTYTLQTAYTNYRIILVHGTMDQKNMDKREQR